MELNIKNAENDTTFTGFKFLYSWWNEETDGGMDTVEWLV